MDLRSNQRGRLAAVAAGALILTSLLLAGPLPGQPGTPAPAGQPTGQPPAPQPAAKPAAPPAAAQPGPPVADDHSLTPEAYSAKGMPAVDKPWTDADYAAALKVL